MQILEPVDATPEDAEIWLSIVFYYGTDWATVGHIFNHADRMDAVLMWGAQIAYREPYGLDGRYRVRL